MTNPPTPGPYNPVRRTPWRKNPDESLVNAGGAVLAPDAWGALVVAAESAVADVAALDATMGAEMARPGSPLQTSADARYGADAVNDPESDLRASLNATIARRIAVVRMSDLGAVADGTDDISNILASALSSSGGALGLSTRLIFDVPGGVYRLDAPVSIARSDVTIEMAPGAKIDASALTGSKAALRAVGSIGSVGVSLSSSAEEGDIALALAEDVAPGWYILGSSDVFNTQRNYKRGEYVYVDSSSGGSAILGKPLYDSYTVAGEARLYPYSPRENLTFVNVTIDMGAVNGGNRNPFYMWGVSNVSFERCVAISGDSDLIGFQVLNAMDVTFTRCLSVGFNADEYGYGYKVFNSENVTFEACFGRFNRHSFDVDGSGVNRSISRNITYAACSAYGDRSSGLSAHGGTDGVTWTGCRTRGCGGGLISRGSNSIISGCDLESVYLDDTETYNSPIVIGDSTSHGFGGIGGVGLSITSNILRYKKSPSDTRRVPSIVSNVPFLGAVIADNNAAGHTSSFLVGAGLENDGLKVNGNYVDNRSMFGTPGTDAIDMIKLAPPTGSALTKNVDIGGNTFIYSLRNMVYIKGSADAETPTENITVHNNVGYDMRRGVDLASGAYYKDVIVTGNILNGSASPLPVLSSYGTEVSGVAALANIVKGVMVA